MLTEALEHLVSGIVSNPDDVRVREKELRRGQMLEVRVNPSDIGKVIGRQGRTASSLRTVVDALAAGEQVRVDFVDVDRRGGRRR
ncbi:MULTISPECIES: RNA-binding protein [Acidipropionibacterium]|uniref:RNA-binding protein n=1 Tax=Acidipropionibacterium TaxID=1912215 RepID=UPI00040A6C57|nr:MULTISPECIES: RNA-binding protein [Acidipropionibacterium]